MIKLSENKVALSNLDNTFNALESINKLITHYSEDKPGPAYCTFEQMGYTGTAVQFNRKVILVALEEQKESLVNYLANLGIDANQ